MIYTLISIRYSDFFKSANFYQRLIQNFSQIATPRILVLMITNMILSETDLISIDEDNTINKVSNSKVVRAKFDTKTSKSKTKVKTW